MIKTFSTQRRIYAVAVILASLCCLFTVPDVPKQNPSQNYNYGHQQQYTKHHWYGIGTVMFCNKQEKTILSIKQIWETNFSDSV